MKKYFKFALVDRYGFEYSLDEECISLRLVLREKNEHTLQVDLKNITDNLIGIWHFEHDANDESGYNNHATINGATFVNGKIGYGIRFDGIDDYIEIGNKYDFIDREPFTISFWIKPDSIPNQWSRIFSKEEYNNGRQGWLIFQDPNGRIGFERWRDDAGGGVLSNAIISSDEFTHVTCSYDGRDMRIYINGLLDSSSSNEVSLIKNDAPLRIGVASYYHGDHFNGIIDEVRIYNRALSSNEVKSVYQARNKSIKLFDGIIIEVDEVGEFDKVISITARDLFKDRLLTSVINKRYVKMKASDIFKDMISTLGSEFTFNGVEDVNLTVTEDFPYFQMQLACDILAGDTFTEYYCKPNLDCVFRQLRIDDSNIIIREDMIKSPAEIKRSYAESVSEVIVVGGLDESNNRVIARAVNTSVPEALRGRIYVLHDKRYTTYTSAKMRALSILEELSRMFTMIEPIFVKDLEELPIPGQLVTLDITSYGIYTKVVVKQVEINIRPGMDTTWFKFFLGESEKSIEDRIIEQQQIFEKERALGTTFDEIAFQRLINSNERMLLIDDSRARLARRFYLDSVPNNVTDALEFGLDGGYASQLDL